MAPSFWCSSSSTLPAPPYLSISSHFPLFPISHLRHLGNGKPDVSASLSSPERAPLTITRSGVLSYKLFPKIHGRNSCDFRLRSSNSKAQVKSPSSSSSASAPSPGDVNCIGTGLDVECVVSSSSDQKFGASSSRFEVNSSLQSSELDSIDESGRFPLLEELLEWGLLVSPFFFWGTAMVAMKGVLPKTGPFFVSSFRLIPAGLLLVVFAASRGRSFPSGLNAWFSICLFSIVDAAFFQGFLAKGLERTSAGLGSVIIDSQPLTVAVLAALLFGESIGFIGAAGLLVGVIGLVLLELPAFAFDDNNFVLWGSGEWWMLLAAQSMAVGTVMVRWVSKYSDPVMATGWHMVIGGIPLAAISILNHDPILSRGLDELTAGDFLALLYTAVFGSAASYGVYFFNATRDAIWAQN